MKPTYQVLSITQCPSRLNGGFYYKIILQNIASMTTYETSVDPTMRNFQNWQEVLGNQGSGQLLQNLDVKQHRNKTLVNADSMPQVVATCDPHEMNSILQKWRNNKPDPNDLWG